MTDQMTVLRILTASNGPLTLDEICAQVEPGVDCRPQSPARKSVIDCLGRLASAGLADSQRTFHAPRSLTHAGSGKAGSSSTWGATLDGRAFIKSGRVIQRGKTGPRPCRTNPKPQSMKQQIWAAFRIKRKATLADLAELVHRPGGPDAVKVSENARQLMMRLVRAGIAVPMQKRVPGILPGRGSIKYSLVRDLGPLVPVCGKQDVFDPNSRNRIAYGEKPHA
jgi:hypothetical protein